MVDETNENLEIRELNNFFFGIVKDNMPIAIDQIKNLDALVIRKTDPLLTYHTVQQIKVDESTNVYLKPLFILGDVEDLDPVTENLIDGNVTSLSYLSYITDQVRFIQEKLKEL